MSKPLEAENTALDFLIEQLKAQPRQFTYEALCTFVTELGKARAAQAQAQALESIAQSLDKFVKILPEVAINWARRTTRGI